MEDKFRFKLILSAQTIFHAAVKLSQLREGTWIWLESSVVKHTCVLPEQESEDRPFTLSSRGNQRVTNRHTTFRLHYALGCETEEERQA
ncbi:hypothetical protein P7K49_009203 [Saguinus oedipus]|uniref:Uncharacterized protein n=1 Tax=Saguinus oedipus TaxID=9490 RepID=A0ABQ9VJD0_SAGOE|nr:hypothetical protein P7K49_009203 [Saguinus oedipus]